MRYVHHLVYATPEATKPIICCDTYARAVLARDMMLADYASPLERPQIRLFVSGPRELNPDTPYATIRDYECPICSRRA